MFYPQYQKAILGKKRMIHQIWYEYEERQLIVCDRCLSSEATGSFPLSQEISTFDFSSNMNNITTEIM